MVPRLRPEDLNPGKLTYTLEGTDAVVALFDIDRETGQLKTKGKLDADANGGDSHTVMVRATDPSGDPQVGTADEDQQRYGHGDHHRREPG